MWLSWNRNCFNVSGNSNVGFQKRIRNIIYCLFDVTEISATCNGGHRGVGIPLSVITYHRDSASKLVVEVQSEDENVNRNVKGNVNVNGNGNSNNRLFVFVSARIFDGWCLYVWLKMFVRALYVTIMIFFSASIGRIRYISISKRITDCIFSFFMPTQKVHIWQHIKKILTI